MGAYLKLLRRSWIFVSPFALVLCLNPLGTSQTQQIYDLVISNGRVMDPESGLDAVRHIGINGRTIQSISERPLDGRRFIDANGLVVSPGFIDLHWHGRDPAYYKYEALQGVTAAMELEIGVADVAAWYDAREGRSIIHYGASAGHAPARMALMKDPGDFLPAGAAANRPATDSEVDKMASHLEEQLRRGAIAVGFGIAYTPSASYKEIYEMFRVAARFGATAHVHMRSGAQLGPEVGLSEVLAAAAATGAAIHVVHINSSAGSSITHMLQIIGDAQKRGIDISTEAYPYTAGSTRIESALFDNWETRPDSYFQTLQWSATGERLTRETFAKYRKLGGRVITHSNTEENVLIAIASPLTMIASDGSDLIDGAGHPRSSGTYPRVLGRYVRDQRAISLMDALRKMTIMPARRLERRVPAMRNKGRIRLGADADITIFDPARVIDRSTYEKPAELPEGVRFVLVNGTPIVSESKLVESVVPGRPLRAPVAP